MASPFSPLTTKGALANFYNAMTGYPAVWPNHCQNIPAGTKTENLSWAGALPIPRLFNGGSRHFQNMSGFTLAVTNNAYELSTIIPREALEDDQTGTIMSRMRELGTAWSMFKDSLLALLIENGNVAGNVAYDGIVFYGDNRTGSAFSSFDNNTTTGAADVAPYTTVPNASELIHAISVVKGLMLRIQDDQGRAGYNANAAQRLRLIVPPPYERACAEATASTTIGNSSTFTSNPWGQGLFEYDILPFLTSDAEMVVDAVGEDRKGFIHMSRTPLEIIMRTSDEDIAENDGLMVLSRERFIMTYGDPARSFLHTFS